MGRTRLDVVEVSIGCILEPQSLLEIASNPGFSNQVDLVWHEGDSPSLGKEAGQEGEEHDQEDLRPKHHGTHHPIGDGSVQTIEVAVYRDPQEEGENRDQLNQPDYDRPVPHLIGEE